MSCTNQLKRLFLLLAFCLPALFLTTACGDDDDDDMVVIEPGDERQTSGFVISAQTPEGSLIAKYLEDLPSGNVDISDGTDFQLFFPVDLFDAAIFSARTDGSAGFAKTRVNGDNEFVEDGVISTIDESSFQIAVRDANTGVFQDRNFPSRISVFDPVSMTVTGTIDVGTGIPPGIEPPRAQTFYFRDNEVFFPLRGNDGASYDSLIVMVANLSTGSYERTITFNSGPAAPFNDFGQHYLDESGNLYIPDQGDVNTGNPASLHRIPAGSDDFDPNYEFNIATTLNPANLFLSIFRGFYYMGNGQALALVATDTPQEAIDIVLAAGGPQNLSPDEVQQVLDILFQAENGRWCLVDVNAQTVSIIDGIPAQSVFATTVTMELNGQYYVPVTTPAINALYRYDPGTGIAEKVFDLTAGGALVGIYNLANNN